MAPGPARPALPALLALIGALLPGLGGAQTSVHPPEAIIPRGGSVQVNCSTSCDQSSTLGLETQLTKKEVAHGVNWKVFELSDVQEDSHPICFANCHKQTMASMSLTVYWFPERVELLPLPRWQPVGENLTLRCQVAGGAPRDSLFVVLLRGEEELSRHPASGEPAEVEVTVPVLAGRDDHLANFSCRTDLDLRPRGLGLFQNISAPRQLRTFVLPETQPRLATPRMVEVGTQWAVNCTMDGLFPAAEAKVGLTLAEQKLPSTSLYSKDSVLAMANVKANAAEEGTQEVACVVTLGEQDRMWKEDVTLYNGPRLDQRDCPGNWTWEEGSQQTLRCQAWGNPVPELKCHRKEDEALLPIGDLRPVKREVAGTYLCQARSPRGVVTREVVLNVTYHQNNMVIIILVAAAVILGTVSAAAYLYNRQRKIQKYRLQKAQEAAAMKLNTPATPP
uniref:intercellular adhesion molecule 1 isoform X2 n=1 Tax=Halichoerus grypus TaxID=9711 RepID=UPI0016597EA9|nr:intercellular adhesion molecule 1 isoform X2 [Halichoerus grypus]